MDLFHRALHTAGHHDLVLHHDGLLHRAQHIAGHHFGAGLHQGLEFPFVLPGQRRCLDTAGDGIPRLFADLFQRALDAVIDLADQAGPQLHRQRRASGIHLFPRADACRLFIDLDGGPVPTHFDDLTDQMLRTYPHHVVHIGVGHPFCNDQGARHLDDLSCILHEKRQPSFY